MYRHVHENKCLFKHPVVAVRIPRVTILPVAQIAMMVLGQLRTTQYAHRLHTAYPNITKHIYANVELFNSKTNSYLTEHNYKKWIETIKPDWITQNEYTRIKLNCSNTDVSKHWPQFGRMYDTFEAIRQHEIVGEYRYEWIVRLRCDLLNTPALNLNFHSLVNAVYINGVWHNWKNRTSQQYLTRDYYFVVPRLQADSFFSLALDFLMCQSHESNMKVCQVSKWLSFPECVLKTHLIVCNISFEIF